MPRAPALRRASAALLLAACSPSSGEDLKLGEAVDERRLDRSEAVGECGYPGPGDKGYGTALGQRIANFSLVDCELQAVEFADLFCKREDEYGDYNKAILLSIGAGWCEPCKAETAELTPEVLEPLHDQGLEIVQVLFEDDQAMPPTSSFCRVWRDELFGEPLGFPVWLDQSFSWADAFLLDPQSATPVSMLIDANGNIRWKVEGQNPPDTYEQALLVLASPYGD
ncbi:MAG: TlpA disulfide reductase family protein [Enhygromyxa sp.]